MFLAMWENCIENSITGEKMVFIKLRETYDLSTKKDKMTMIGIHTPSMSWLVRQYYGLFLNCKKFRFVSAKEI